MFEHFCQLKKETKITVLERGTGREAVYLQEFIACFCSAVLHEQRIAFEELSINNFTYAILNRKPN
jgi:hypothetical protein